MSDTASAPEAGRTRLLLVRHGETEWSHDRRHTGRTDVPLTEVGVAEARVLGWRRASVDLTAVWSSPLRRAADTARLAGLRIDRLDDDLVEWDYGAAEGRTTDEIRRDIPGWDIWRDGVTVLGGGGETVEEVGVRADAVIARARTVDGTIALIAHAHLLRVLTARWIGLAPVNGAHLSLDPAGWAMLGWERETPVIERWNPPPADG